MHQISILFYLIYQFITGGVNRFQIYLRIISIVIIENIFILEIDRMNFKFFNSIIFQLGTYFFLKYITN